MNAPAEPRPRSRPRARRIVARVIGLAVLLILQWSLAAIPTIDAAQFDRWAVELERSATWRYGYAQEYHGAVLVKAALSADATPLVPPTGDRLAALMARELRTAPWKAGMELAFYAGLFLLGRHALPRLPLFRAAAQHRVRWSLGAALSVVAFVTAAMAPYLALGYGEPLFSTYRGAGALSYSGLVPITAPVTPAVSYGLLLQWWVLIWPLMAGQWAAEPLSSWLGIRASLWCVTSVFWGLLTMIGAWFAWIPPPAQERDR